MTKTRRAVKKRKEYSIPTKVILLTLAIGLIFMTVYLLIENIGIHSIFSFETSIWTRSTEGYIFFAIVLLLSIFIGSYIVLYLLKKKR